MANPFYKKAPATAGSGMNFPQFMQMMRGKNPSDIIAEMISNGQINQEQLNLAQAKAKEMSSSFDCFKTMFGFNK